MKKYIIWFLVYLLFIFFLYAVQASAITAIPTATEITLSYDEPTTNADGTPLTDFDHVNIYQDGIKLSTTSPATSANGGGKSVQVKITINAIGKVVSFFATAVDTSGNESIPSNTVIVDRLAPAPVQ
jgi:hypothetical protein